MRSLLAGLTARDIRLDPFPHVVVPDALDAVLYEALSASFPPFARIAWAGMESRIPSNRRYALSAKPILEAHDLPDCWKAFVGRHSGPDFLGEVAALFAGHWPAAMLAALDGRLDGHDCTLLDYVAPGPGRIRQDARIEINTPVKDRPSTTRGPHLDTFNRLYSGLFYMRAPDDDAVGGDLVLYRWKGRPAVGHSADVGADAVEAAVTIPYRANQLVLFPHSPHALHGVSPRWPTPHTRRYVFITAELAEDWLVPPGLTH